MKQYNYNELCRVMKEVALAHPFVNNVYFDRYMLNSIADIEYPAIVIFHNHTEVGGNISTYSFSMMFVDRLLEDRSNMIPIQSTGKQAITEVMNALRNNFDVDTDGNLRFEVFKDQYADGLAGVVCTVVMTTASNIGECDWLSMDHVCTCGCCDQ